MSVPPWFLKGLMIRKFVVFSGYTLLLYDYLITFPLEVQHIWKAPLTPAKVAFLTNRYGNVIGQTIVMLEETGYLSGGSEHFCTFFRLFTALFAIFSTESIRILVLMRSCAIWGCRYSITIFSVFLYVLYIIVVLATIIYAVIASRSIRHAYLKQTGVCVGSAAPYIWLMWVATLSLDTMVLAMVWYSLRKIHKESRGPYPSSLVRLLVRDAVFFYAVSVFNSVFSMVCWTVYQHDPRCFLGTGISFPLLSVVGQRLVFNLRAFQERIFTTRDISREVDRQMEAMGDPFWPEVGAMDDGPADSDSGETSRVTRTSAAIKLTGIRPDRIQSGDDSRTSLW